MRTEIQRALALANGDLILVREARSRERRVGLRMSGGGRKVFMGQMGH